MAEWLSDEKFNAGLNEEEGNCRGLEIIIIFEGRSQATIANTKTQICERRNAVEKLVKKARKNELKIEKPILYAHRFT